MERSKVYSILANLKLWQKLFLFAALGFVLIAVLFLVYLEEANETIESARKELSGLQLLENIMLVKQLTQEHRGLSQLTLYNDNSVETAKNAVYKRINQEYQQVDNFIKTNINSKDVESAWSAAYEAWQNTIKIRLDSELALKVNYARHGNTIADLMRVKSRLMEYYGLSFDPTADGHYLIEAIFKDNPNLTESFGQLRALGATIIASGIVSLEDRVRVADLINQTRSAFNDLDLSLQKAIEYNHELDGTFKTEWQKSVQLSNKVIDLSINEIIEPDVVNYSSADYLDRCTQAINAQYILNFAVINQLKAILKNRVENRDIKRYGLVALMILVTCLATYIGYIIIKDVFRQLLIGLQQQDEHKKQINRLFFYDELTNLPNRRLLASHLKLIIENNHLKNNSALLLIDINGFKKINDALGYEAGDEILIGLAKFFKQNTKEHDLVARIGGDEFAIVLDKLAIGFSETVLAHKVIKIANRLRNKLIDTPIKVGGGCYRLNCSIGVSLISSNSCGVNEVIRQADLALQETRQISNGHILFYETAIQIKAEERLLLEQELPWAVNKSQLKAFVQPKYASNGAINSAELLCRWLHPSKGLIAPAIFIPIAEENNLIDNLTIWMFLQACRAIDQLSELNLNISLSINVSPKSIINAEFVNFIKKYLKNKHYGDYLVFEITENIWLEDKQGVIKHLQELNALGVRFSVDDFGTGYSNLSAIKKLPFYELKIDKSLIDELITNEDNKIIIRSILAMANQLGLKTVAEGVEQVDEAEFLFKYGCDLIQGYLYAKPMPLQAWLLSMNNQAV